jgi:hypothetical protein
MKHPLKFVTDHGKLGEALGIDRADPMSLRIEKTVEDHLAQRKNLVQLLTAVGDLDISDELWANFLYTFGWWQAGGE